MQGQTQERLVKYTNNNYDVEIFRDGTKIRSWEEGTEPDPSYPESIDLKITNYCDAGCAFCHETSTILDEISPPLDAVLDYLSPIGEGLELAIGGGNPLAHKDLEDLLQTAKARGWICNMTVHTMHAHREQERIQRLLDDELIWGLGISGTADLSHLFNTPNLVNHVIMGVHAPHQVRQLKRFLLLGYKFVGRGMEYGCAGDRSGSFSDKMAKITDPWNEVIHGLLHSRQISFDNLAISQLELRRFFTPEEWDEFFMGHDGTFTMYVDAEEQAVAESSYEDLEYWKTIEDDFYDIRRNAQGYIDE